MISQITGILDNLRRSHWQPKAVELSELPA